MMLLLLLLLLLLLVDCFVFWCYYYALMVLWYTFWTVVLNISAPGLERYSTQDEGNRNASQTDQPLQMVRSLNQKIWLQNQNSRSTPNFHVHAPICSPHGNGLDSMQAKPEAPPTSLDQLRTSESAMWLQAKDIIWKGWITREWNLRFLHSYQVPGRMRSSSGHSLASSVNVWISNIFQADLLSAVLKGL